MMAKLTSKKQPSSAKAKHTGLAGKELPSAETEKLALAKARAAFAEQARVRGEVAADDKSPLASGTLFTESATGELTRHRFSALSEPPSDGLDY